MIDVRCSFTEIGYDKTLMGGIKKWAKVLWFVRWGKGCSTLPIRWMNSRSHNAWAPKRPWGNGRSPAFQPGASRVMFEEGSLNGPCPLRKGFDFVFIFMTKQKLCQKETHATHFSSLFCSSIWPWALPSTVLWLLISRVTCSLWCQHLLQRAARRRDLISPGWVLWLRRHFDKRRHKDGGGWDLLFDELSVLQHVHEPANLEAVVFPAVSP